MSNLASRSLIHCSKLVGSCLKPRLGNSTGEQEHAAWPVVTVSILNKHFTLLPPLCRCRICVADECAIACCWHPRFSTKKGCGAAAQLWKERGILQDHTNFLPGTYSRVSSRWIRPSKGCVSTRKVQICPCQDEALHKAAGIRIPVLAATRICLEALDSELFAPT